MIFVLDTNIIQEDFLTQSGKFEILLDYLHKTKSKIVLPKIVYDELAANYEREISKRFNQFLRAKGALASIMVNPKLSDTTLSISDEITAYLKHVKCRLGIKDEEIFDYKESYLHDVLGRAIQRRPPCTDRGEEIRDAVLWHCILDIAQEAKDKTVMFISRNTKQFACTTEALHPELIEEATRKGIIVRYFTSLDSFAKQQASQIDFITKEWLLEALDINDVLVAAEDLIQSLTKVKLSQSLSEEEYPTGYINIRRVSLDVNEFYVYEMSDGSLRIEVLYKGEVEAECEIEKLIPRGDCDYGVTFVNGMYNRKPINRFHQKVEAMYRYIQPTISLFVDVIVRDKEVTQLEIICGKFE
jgi:PIN domain-containing protein